MNGTLKPHRGTMILVLGILSLVCCGIFTAIPAWIMGNGDLKEMAEGRMDPSGEGMTKAGKICGMIGVILFCIWLVFILFFGGLGALSAMRAH
ncbi:MAG TPA: DUF4190 domain-containing protein [Holophagaceae bacterium]|nr:DUF4190 domain-containing protein [Holophagaceae bacterium]